MFKPTTNDWRDAKESLDVAVLAASHIQRISQLLKKGLIVHPLFPPLSNFIYKSKLISFYPPR